MILQKLTSDNVKNLYNKKICCFEYSASYLKELCVAYDVAEKIDKIVDANVRNQGIHNLNGRNIEVCGTEYFESLDILNTAVLITSDYFMEAYEKLCSIPLLKASVDTAYYFVNKETEYEFEYR